MRTGPLRAIAAGGVALSLVVAAATPAVAAVTQRQTIDSWAAYSNGGAELTVAADTTDPHSGAAALRLDFESPRAGGSYAGVAQGITITPSTSYTVSGWAKGEDVNGADANRLIYNEDWSANTFLPDGTFGWTAFETTFTSGASQSVLALTLIGQDTGTLWLDDLSVVATGTTTNLVQNGGFESYSDRVTVENENLMFSPGDVSITLSASSPSVGWNVANSNGALVRQGTATVTDGAAAIDLDDLPAGYYDLRLLGGTHYQETSFAVIADLDVFPDASTNPFGVAAHPDYETELDHTPLLADLGVGSVRIDVRWQYFEQVAGEYVFDTPIDWDATIDGYLAQGIRPLLILGYANPLHDDDQRPHTASGRQAYADYAAAIAERYGNEVDYEIYNEYNHPGGYHLGPCGADLSCYNAMLSEAAQAIRAEVPDARITLTGIAGLTSWWLGNDQSGHPEYNFLAYDWLEGFLASDAVQYVDVINIHNYSFPAAPEGNNDAVIRAVRDLMSEYPAAAGKELWLTETGYPTVSGASNMNTEPEQARYLVRDAALSIEAGLDRYMVYDLLNDYAEETAEGRFGLVRNIDTHPALAPKPAFVSYSVFTHQLDGYEVQGQDDLGSGVYSVLFENTAGQEKRIMWATQPATVSIATTAAVQTVGLYGATASAVPDAGAVTVNLGQDPVYVSGAGVSGVSVLGTPLYDAVAPAETRQNQPIPVTVAVDLSDGGSVAGPVLFADQTGQGVEITPVSGERVEATLTVPGYAEPGSKTIPITVSRGGDLLASLNAVTQVRENPALLVRPAITGDVTEVGPLELLIDYEGGSGVTVQQVDYAVGGQSASITPGTALPSGVSTTVPLPLSGVWPWGGVYYSLTLTLSDGTVKTAAGVTAFAPVFLDGTTDAPRADLATSATWVGSAPSGPDDHAGTMWLSHDEDTITVHAIVTDDVHAPDAAAPTLWQGDSIQFAFSEDRPGAGSPGTSFGAALLSGGPVVQLFSGSGGEVASASASIVRDETDATTSYEITVPKSVAGIDPAAERFSYSFLVNDADGAGREGYLEWGSGIGNVVGPSQYLPVYFAAADPGPEEPEAPAEPVVKVYAQLRCVLFAIPMLTIRAVNEGTEETTVSATSSYGSGAARALAPGESTQWWTASWRTLGEGFVTILATTAAGGSVEITTAVDGLTCP